MLYPEESTRWNQSICDGEEDQHRVLFRSVEGEGLTEVY